MNNAVFTYNQEQAVKVGAGEWLTTSGGYDVSVSRAQFTNSKTAGSQARFLELDFVTREGQKCNYVNICYTKGDGQPLGFGGDLIQAIMGCCGAGQLTTDQQGNCPELLKKNFKAILQKTDYTNNNGEDKYKFELKLPAQMNGLTIKESATNQPPTAFSAYAESVADKDERKPKSAQQQSRSNAPQQQAAPAYAPVSEPTQDFDDDIPF